MLSIDLPQKIEKQFKDVVRDSYQGNLKAAITSFLRMHKKYGWKEQLLEDVNSIRAEVKNRGGIKTKEIDRAIKKYRKSIVKTNV